MSNSHRDFDGSLKEPIMSWGDMEYVDARADPTLTKWERSQIERVHGPLNDPYP
ncbi:hypothetical protein [Haloarcula sediminis]|uniref:hypothetical protein n=1 Tax=Haloarcula sediminis TaxID=3111777 RepID=UPI002D77D008|nr:hypothetical protein [Haloarcula sp. CK38]